jgi:predicted type IV restriction endonuclease
MMTLQDEITEAQDYITEPPKNESSTCDWIILPLLLATGYARRDIESRMADSTGQFPDYSLLPSHSTATYYLEAKAWNVTLEDIHVKQALNYANHNGKRFVVLTNGQHWRLYDNAIQGLLEAKLIIYAALRDTSQITNFLTMISKPQVLDGSLERIAASVSQYRLQEAQELQERQQHEAELQSIYKRQQQIKELLDTALPDLLSDLKGKLIVLMANYLSQETELGDISPESLSGWFDERLHQPSLPLEEQSPDPRYTPAVPLFLLEQQEKHTLTLTELKDKTIDGKKSRPFVLHAPDGTSFPVGSWVKLAAQAISWLLQQSQPMPIPFVSTHRTRYFLNSVGEHKRPDIRKNFQPISAHGKTVYMDTDRSAQMFLTDIYALCLAMKIDPNAFRITVLF